ncbi:putative transcriptional regulator [Thermosipho africanus H17ap60334]|uniref:ArsR/SmtB family transcription factor n=1 Tax=Thermosipho africanus TaxID=2421 RepID=UPI00028DB3EC|nr:metalloregulator ArsR/SmtB family transcription factor [Thermosipho africanus]EKF48594.1 putative transcriptional regulator [Thermosipho africanus H17ap60334]
MNKNIEVCQTIEIHEDIVKMVQKNTPDEQTLNKLTELFKIMGDKTRMKILYALLQVGEMCVCDLSYVLGKSPSAISHQLRVLRQADLVKFRKEGKVVYYSLNDQHVKEILDVGYSHVIEG